METLVVGPISPNDHEAYHLASVDDSGEQFFVFGNKTGMPFPHIEEVIFEGTYSKIRFFFGEQLPVMRRALLDAAKGKDFVRLYLGAEMGTLYAAYYCAVEGLKFDLILVNPQYLGGKMIWSQRHPLLINKLLTTAFLGATEVFINGADHFEALPKSFPRIGREYQLLDLPSQREDGGEALGSPSTASA